MVKIPALKGLDGLQDIMAHAIAVNATPKATGLAEPFHRPSQKKEQETSPKKHIGLAENPINQDATKRTLLFLLLLRLMGALRLTISSTLCVAEGFWKPHFSVLFIELNSEW